MCHHLGVDMGVDADRSPSGDPADASLRHHLRIVAERSVGAEACDMPDALTRNRFDSALWGDLRRRSLQQPVTSHGGWKFPETYLTGPAVRTTFPSARYVHVVRDSRDVAFKRHLTDVHGTPPGASHPAAVRCPRHAPPPAGRCLLGLPGRPLRTVRHDSPAGSIVTIRYEDLVVSPPPLSPNGHRLPRRASDGRSSAGC